MSDILALEFLSLFKRYFSLSFIQYPNPKKHWPTWSQKKYCNLSRSEIWQNLHLFIRVQHPTQALKCFDPTMYFSRRKPRYPRAKNHLSFLNVWVAVCYYESTREEKKSFSFNFSSETGRAEKFFSFFLPLHFFVSFTFRGLTWDWKEEIYISLFGGN